MTDLLDASLERRCYAKSEASFMILNFRPDRSATAVFIATESGWLPPPGETPVRLFERLPLLFPSPLPGPMEVRKTKDWIPWEGIVIGLPPPPRGRLTVGIAVDEVPRMVPPNLVNLPRLTVRDATDSMLLIPNVQFGILMQHCGGYFPAGTYAVSVQQISAKHVVAYLLRLGKTSAGSEPSPVGEGLSQGGDSFGHPEVPEFLPNDDDESASPDGESSLAERLALAWWNGPARGFQLSHFVVPSLLRLTGEGVLAFDPIVGDALPLDVRVPAGDYPVVLTLATFPNGSAVVAFASLRLAATQPTTWRTCGWADSGEEQLDPDEVFGHSVDSGTSCFADPSLMRVFAERPGGPMEIVDALNRNDRSSWSWAEWSAAPGKLIAFSAGGGDGFYTTYAGYDDDGVLVALVTDFEIVEERPE